MTTTTTTTVPVPAHVVAVLSDGDEYQASCSCGWLSEWHFTPDEADEAGTDHRDGAVEAADHMDELVTGLLDLCDDIAAAVVWLAENWSTSLPWLGWAACGDDHRSDQPALRILGYCQPAELAAVAAVMGGPTVDVPTSGGDDRRRRVMRDFGRVRIDVFTDLVSARAAEASP
jgi:hypothetical protein